jgi:hypothetical protein
MNTLPARHIDVLSAKDLKGLGALTHHKSTGWKQGKVIKVLRNYLHVRKFINLNTIPQSL